MSGKLATYAARWRWKQTGLVHCPSLSCLSPISVLLACRRYLQAAAALVLHPGSAVAGELLRLLCWVPAKRFTPRLLEVARLCWCWTWAATGIEMQVETGKDV